MRLGFGEIAIILVVALLFFGPSKLPQLGKSLGDAIRGFKKGLSAGDDEPVNAPVNAPPPAVANTPANQATKLPPSA